MLIKFHSFLGSCAAFTIAFFASVAKADVIYQAFNTPFKDVKTQLSQIKKLGYTYVQVSPPQKSHSGNEWFFRYQPIDHTKIEGPLGSESQLKELIDEAHRRGIKIIVDVVLNHMADEGNLVNTLQFPRFPGSNFFHSRQCITEDDYRNNNRAKITTGWLGNCPSGNLPDLKTETPFVRQEAKKYLQKLLALGVDGFRFDAAKHIEPDYFREVLAVVPSSKFRYGEVIAQNTRNSFESKEYTDIFPITDFYLVQTMLDAFKSGGDLRSLNTFGNANQALPGVVAVTFAEDHDQVKHRIGFEFPSRQDKLLATAFVLARQDGFPLVYGGDPRPPAPGDPPDSGRSDADDPIVKAGVIFHEKMMGKGQFFRNGNDIAPGADNPNTVFIERGNASSAEGLAIINKAGEFFDVAVAKMPGMKVGCYRELLYNFTMSVGTGGDGQKYINRWGTPQRGGISIGPRSALFFIQTAPQECR